MYTKHKWESDRYYNFGYVKYLPRDYDESKTYPLVFFLHGAGERGDDLDVASRHGFMKHVRENGAITSANSIVVTTEYIDTVRRVRFGISIPMVPRPGIGTMSRMLIALSEMAISSSRLLMRATFTPISGSIS